MTEPLKAACSTLVGPVVEAVCKLISRVDPEFQRQARHGIILGGGGSQLKGLDASSKRGLQRSTVAAA
ncbi:MAG: hypothetical protein U0792_18210 [Gemmataceae bacterium]